MRVELGHLLESMPGLTLRGMSHALTNLLLAPPTLPSLSEFNAAMRQRGVETILDLLLDFPTSYAPWRAERDLRHAMGAARRRGAREAEIERLAVERDLAPHEEQDDVDCLVFLEGYYERSPNWESVTAELALRGDDDPMEFGEFRTDAIVATIFNVPIERSGSRLWVLCRLALGDEGDPMLFSELEIPERTAEVVPRWSGLNLGVSIARLNASISLFDRMRSLATTEERRYVDELALTHAPTGVVDLNYDRLQEAVAWLGRCTVLASDEEKVTSVSWDEGEPVLPQTRMLKGHVAAEEFAAEVLVSLGFRDASRTPTGADGGVDVAGSGVVAQVKMEALPTGRDRLQALYGVASVEHVRAVFFSLAGYTAQAIEWADRAGIALLEFEFDGSIAAVNGHGSELLRKGIRA